MMIPCVSSPVFDFESGLTSKRQESTSHTDTTHRVALLEPARDLVGIVAGGLKQLTAPF